MIKMTMFLKRDPKLTHEEFVAHHIQKHGPLFKSIPEAKEHVLRYIQTHPIGEKTSILTVNAIVAGSTKTAGVATFIQDLCPGLSLEEAEKRFMGERGHRSSALLQRLIDPKEIADFVTYVSSPLASASNGAALRIDGGLVRSVF